MIPLRYYIPTNLIHNSLHKKKDKELVVVKGDAVIDPGTVVVHLLDTPGHTDWVG